MKYARKFIYILIATASISVFGADPIKLEAPDMSRGESLMKAFANRASAKNFALRKLSVRDLSDLLWAANGINRPDSGKRTAPSAMNRQDIKIYVCLQDGAYLYDAAENLLKPITDEDIRQSKAPATLVLVSDFNDKWSPLDAGIVSQNISLFCAGAGLATYPHTTMDVKKIKSALKLEGSQTPMICNSVGYAK